MVNPKKPGIGDQTPEATAIWISFSRLRSAIAAVANKGADRIANMVLVSRGGIHFFDFFARICGKRMSRT
jgi:hypothetical protein